ncbi:MAG: hypothetical protein IMX00_01315 [Limnochordales bacterium]|nr:hypothetical protein [Limnochordales bacterium]
MIELFLLETSTANPDPQVLEEESGWRLTQERAGSARVSLGQRALGRLIALDPRQRYWAFYPAPGVNARGEVAVMVDRSTYFDRLWLSPPLLACFWEKLVASGTRYSFSYLVYAREHSFRKQLEERIEETEVEPERTVITVAASSSSIRRAGGPLLSGLPLPTALAAVKVQSDTGYLYLSRAGYLRISSEELGEDVPELIAAYSRATALIEARLGQMAVGSRAERSGAVAAGLEPDAGEGKAPVSAGRTWPGAAPDPDAPGDEDEGVGQLRRRGLPLTLLFSEPLPPSILASFLAWLDEGGGSLRLWGRGKRVGEQRWQVRALDLHLRREVELELSPRQLVFVWPPGACGNSLHRAVTHMLYHLDPRARVFVGNRRYEDLLRDAFAPAGSHSEDG